MALLFGTSVHAQYSATSLTRKVVPQQQQPAAPARPQYAVPAQQPAAAPRELTPEESKKAAIQQNKNDVKQFDFYKRRAEEGSDDAQYQLGIRYLAAKGTVKNEKLGREWLAKAAKKGHVLAGKKLAELGPEQPDAKTAAAVTPSVPATPASTPVKK
jgi:TPR repeat protein